ncbi:MAG: VPLPA-CTERM-specific exosortase XrtD [Xanthomonadaceae bacterium]|nr:VPLPA-CTERM-specific exosortase XrtD [Xanthomonadaceae bacterium]
MSPLLWALVALGLALLGFASLDSLADMVYYWDNREEYGYGYMIPVITLFLIWQRKDKLEQVPFTGSWVGVGWLLLGVLIVLVGQLSTIHSVTNYGFVIAIVAGAYALLGWQAFRIIMIPLLLLFLMVPLPNFILNSLSAQLQLISSEIGVFVIRLFDISVHLEGNVIDLGTYQLQVVEACSGLNYLFPLIALSIIASYFYQAAVWKRVVLILSSIPITVLMNSFRIGVIGVLVEYYGIEQAEGFLHDFEGWIIFMACVALLILEIWILSFVGKDRRPFREIFGMDFPEPTPEGAVKVSRTMPRQALVAVALLAVGTASAVVQGEREEIIPERADFVAFPSKLEGWEGHSRTLESIVLDALKLDDYLHMDYVNDRGEAANLYVAYYSSQRSGAAAHSPRTCLPGSGWRITSHTQIDLGDGLRTNRFIIAVGEQRQLVYYWFKQRDRIVTNEYLVKWYLLWDALTRNRTDGALVRLTTVLQPGEDAEAGDERLRALVKVAVPRLAEHIPD